MLTNLGSAAIRVQGQGEMIDALMSNDELDGLRSDWKRVTNPGARWREKPGRHRQQNFNAETEGGAVYRIYLRQNLDDDQDFSCGLALVQRGGRPLSLVRYNGASHAHGEIRYRCHIHRATAEAISAGRKVDSNAVETDRYRTVEGALACLIEDCGVQGLTAHHDEQDLFDGP